MIPKIEVQKSEKLFHANQQQHQKYFYFFLSHVVSTFHK